MTPRSPRPPTTTAIARRTTASLCAGLLLAACTSAGTKTPSGPSTTRSTTSSPASTSSSPSTTTAATTTASTSGTASTSPASCIDLSRWSPAALALQTVAVPVDEGDPNSIQQAVSDGVGGVVLFGADATANLGSQLAALRTHARDGLLVMTDEEGGGIQRLASIVPNMPWPRQMAATMTTAQVWNLTHNVGSKMSRYGVNMDLAPVLDVDPKNVPPSQSDPDGYRSFSGSTSVVSAYGVAYLAGLMRGGVIATVKHFPGLGQASGNTDYGPAHTLPWSTLQKVAIPPFQAAVDYRVPAVMTSNASVPGLTSEPSSISWAVTTHVLRRELGFKGLIVTDSLSAGALSDIGFSVPNASAAALEAGADMVLYGELATTADDVNEAIAIEKADVAALDAGHLLRSYLQSAAAEVLRAKHYNVCS